MDERNMKAAIFEGPERIELKEIAIPSITKGEALVQVHYCGICGSDLTIFHGQHPRAEPPLIMGHEFSGEIVEINSKHSPIQKGEKIVVKPTYSCHQCYPCQKGDYHVCKDLKLQGIDRDGGFAEFAKVPVQQIFSVPDKLDTKLATLTEPLAVAVHAVRSSCMKVGDHIAVLGAGPIGILVGAVANFAGAESVTIFDINRFRVSRANQLGIIGVNNNQKDPVKTITKRTNGKMVDVTFEAAGVNKTAEIISEITKISGQIMIVGVFDHPPQVDLLSVNFKEQELLGSRVYTRDDFKKALNILQRNKELSKVITEVRPLGEIEKVFTKSRGKEESLKTLIKLGI